MGLSAYDADGRKRFHLFRDEPIYFVQVSEPYAYVWRETSVPPAVRRPPLGAHRGYARRLPR
jgi:hypothetical protein